MKQTLAIFCAVLSLSVASVAAFAQTEQREPNVPATATVQPADGAGERLTVEEEAKDAPASKGLKLETKITTRLPNGYRTVVSASQKEEIYALQKSYGELIGLLKLRIELLESELDNKVDALLDDTQKKTLRQNGQLQSEKKKKTAAKK